MLRKQYPYYVANEARQPNADLDVTDKYTGEVATRVAMADEAAIDEAIAAADNACEAIAAMPDSRFSITVCGVSKNALTNSQTHYVSRQASPSMMRKAR